MCYRFLDVFLDKGKVFTILAAIEAIEVNRKWNRMLL